MIMMNIRFSKRARGEGSSGHPTGEVRDADDRVGAIPIARLYPYLVFPRLFTYLADRFRRVKLKFKESVVLYLNRLGEQFYSKNLIVRSFKAFETALELDPDNAHALWNLHGIYNQLGFAGRRLELMEKRIKDDPDDMFGYLHLVEHHLSRGEAKETALWYLQEASRRDPHHPAVDLMQGLLHRFNDDLDGADACIRKALEKAPHLNFIRELLASNLKDQNRKGEAIGVLEEAVRIDPDDAGPYRELCMSRYYKSSDHPHIEKMKRIIQRRSPTNGWLGLQHALGHVYDSLGLYDQAFDHFRTANDFLKQLFRMDYDREKQWVDRLIAFFHREFLSGWFQARNTRSGENLVFIVGMPRSGSTLVEQILASHPEVDAGGERLEFPALVGSLPHTLNTEEDFPSCVRLLDAGAVERISEDYLARVAGPERRGRVHTDKMLSNYQHLGLISLLFPGARIYYCKRNPIDVCLSCYFHALSQISYTYDLNDVAFMYCEHERLMAHWRASLPVEIFEVEYEKLVIDPEPWIRRMLDHCGLPWDPACLEFHRTQRHIETSSRFQVKSPIYTGSAGRWKNYEKHIPELIRRFDMR